MAAMTRDGMIAGCLSPMYNLPKALRASRSIVLACLVLAALKLVPFPQSWLSTRSLITLTDCALATLAALAAWQASRRSRSFPRIVWSCIAFAALLWAINFAAGFISLMFGSSMSALSARWAAVVLLTFPFTILVTLPLLLSEDRDEFKVGWLQAIDITQFAVIIFSAYLVFFYIPALQILSDAQRARYLIGMHLMRDSFLVLGYLYRGWRSRFSDVRRLCFQLAGFFAVYALPAVFLPARVARYEDSWLLSLVSDVAPLFLVIIAVTWRQQNHVIRAEKSDKRMEWVRFPTVIMPLAVVALVSQIPAQHSRAAWIMVTISFACYAGRLFVMQRNQEAALFQLAAAEEKFSKAFNSSPVAMTMTRLADGMFIEANDRALQTMKKTREETIGRTSVELGILAPEERAKMLDALNKHGSVRDMKINFQSPRHPLETLMSAEVVEVEGERVLISSVLDLTELTNVVRQLQESQRMEVVGRLAGGVAHDFNNLLTVISGNAFLALQRPLDAGLAEEIGQIKEASQRAAALTGQLLAFSRRQVLRPRNINLNEVVVAIVSLLRRTIGENIALHTHLAADSGAVHVDPVQMEQVVMNLALNARDAMPNGGTLSFETDNLDLTLSCSHNGLELPSGRYVTLTITDTGSGILPEHLNRIFEPFFTTKETGKGTGLGLSTVYGIVRQSGGYVWADSHVGAGTAFKVCLPRVDSAADAIALPAAAGQLHGTETVLVVDDDHGVCELTAKILEQFGYRVLASHSGAEALQQADAFNADIDLLVTDVVMPQMSGWELARRLKVNRPGLKIIYVSGHSDVSRNGEQPVRLPPILCKPFSPQDLALRVRELLDSIGTEEERERSRNRVA
jgi:PAS domain S-box-containing protein